MNTEITESTFSSVRRADVAELEHQQLTQYDCLQ